MLVKAANEEQEHREQEKREKRVYGNWRRLIRGLLIRERLQAKYFRNLAEEEISPENSTTAEVSKINQNSLPNKKASKRCSTTSKQRKTT